jgi:hypothetical protein
MRDAKRLSPEKLMRAIRGQGLTFAEAAQRARRHLPEGSRLSHTSVWAYATGRDTPKRLRYIEALEKAVGAEPNSLSDEGEHPTAAFPKDMNPFGASRPNDQQDIMLVLSDVGDGRAYVKMRLSLPWPVALKVLEALRDETDVAFDN